MKILITGSNGMLGSMLYGELVKDTSYQVAGMDITKSARRRIKPGTFATCDITDCKKLKGAIKSINPDFIIHAACYTDVDGCELDKEKAEEINSLGTRYVAEAASENKSTLMYISTDFVFDGRKTSPYKEDDATGPINVYGESKLKGEKHVIEIMKNDFFIIRTSWLYGPDGKNFIDTVLNNAKKKEPLKIVSDQFGSPTYTLDLTNAIIKIIKTYEKNKEVCGTYHITNSDDCSWYKLAEKILELASIYPDKIIPLLSIELDRPAERPLMSILDNSCFQKVFNERLRPWQRALEDYLALQRRKRHV